MQAKTFSLGVTGVFALLALCVWGLIWWMPEARHMDGEYPLWMQQKDYVTTDADQQEILLLGDSAVMDGVRTKAFHEDAYNLAMGGATPIEMYYTLEDYLTHHPAPKMVIIAFTPRHYFDLDCYIGRAVYFHYLDAERIRAVNRVLRKRDGTDVRLESLEYILRAPRIYMKRVLMAIRHPRTEENHQLYLSKAEGSGSYMFPGLRPVENVEPPDTAMGPFRPRRSLTEYMDKIIERCLAEGIEVHIEQMPMGTYGWKKLAASGYLQDYARYIQGVSDRYGIDANTTVPSYDDEYFGDMTHLNASGAERFTKELREKYFGAR